MLERLKSFLGSLREASRDQPPGADDPLVAVAALMIYVADADGARDAAEGRQLRATLAEAYDLSGERLETILSAGEAATREAIDFYAFTSVLNRTLDHEARLELIGILWEVVYADGKLHELEDNVVWRVAELIGVSQRDRVLARRQARAAAGVESDRGEA